MKHKTSQKLAFQYEGLTSSDDNNQTKRLIIFTDLDGTLLDHDTYRFDAARGALEKIRALAIPLIINSSKTFSEILAVQQDLGICQPFISENGAAVYWPEKNEQGVVWRSQNFAMSRARILSILSALRQAHGFIYKGFSQCDVRALRALTGLNFAEATRANKRGFSEPLLWLGREEELLHFREALAEHQLIVQQGGRFLTVSSEVNKADAMHWLCSHLGGTWLRVALGDSPNDELMLNAADIAVVVRSARSAGLVVDQCTQVIHTQRPGPAGWQCAIDKLLPGE